MCRGCRARFFNSASVREGVRSSIYIEERESVFLLDTPLFLDPLRLGACDVALIKNRSGLFRSDSVNW